MTPELSYGDHINNIIALPYDSYWVTLLSYRVKLLPENMVLFLWKLLPRLQQM